MKKLTYLVPVVAVFLLLNIPVLAQDHLNINELTSISHEGWDLCSAVTVSGNYAYVLDEGFGMRIVDISYSRDPEPVGGFEFDGNLLGLSVSGDLCCVAAGMDGVLIINISDPQNPRQIGQCQEVGNTRGVLLSDAILYVASGSDGIFVVNMDDPENPIVVGSCGVEDFAVNMALSGDLLLVTDRQRGLKLVDVSDPENPSVRGGVAANGTTIDVAVEGNFAYLGESTVVAQIDISDPNNPVRTIESDVSQPAMAVSVSEGILYAALTAYGVFSVRPVANDLNETGTIYSWGPADVFASGSLVWTTGRDIGLKAIDCSDPSNPLEHGRCGSELAYQSVFAVGDRLYAGTSNVGTLCYDVSDPQAPLLIWQNSPRYTVVTCEVYTAGGLLISGEETSHDHPIRVGDISDPDTLRWLSAGNLRGDHNKASIWQDRLYIAGGNIYIYDISNPNRLEEIGAIWESSYNDIVADGDLLYMTAGDSVRNGGRFVIYDVADYMRPSLVGSLSLGVPTDALAISGDLAYVGLDNGMAVVDVSDPRRPELVGRIDLPGRAVDIKLQGEFAVVACENQGLRVILIDDPVNMVETGFYDTPGEALDVTVFGHTVAVADNESLRLYDCSAAFDPNRAPVWEAGSDEISMQAGESAEMTCRASDPEGDNLAITFDPNGLPEIYEFTDNGDGSGILRLQPAAIDTGIFYPRLIASDGKSFSLLTLNVQILGPSSTDEDDPGNVVLPSVYSISAFPNPFNSVTSITYGLPETAKISLRIYDITGREVASLVQGQQRAGFHKVAWQGVNQSELPVASGMYFIRMEAGQFVKTQKMMLVK